MATLVHPESRIPLGLYRAIVIDVCVTEIPEGFLVITLHHILLSKSKRKSYKFMESFILGYDIVRSAEFFGFLESSNVDFGTIDELKGMVFDTVVDSEQFSDKRVLTQKKLVAQPFND